jgi:hypothetical protein
MQKLAGRKVSFGSKADITTCSRNVRCYPPIPDFRPSILEYFANFSGRAMRSPLATKESSRVNAARRATPSPAAVILLTARRKKPACAKDLEKSEIAIWFVLDGSHRAAL